MSQEIIKACASRALRLLTPKNQSEVIIPLFDRDSALFLIRMLKKHDEDNWKKQNASGNDTPEETNKKRLEGQNISL